MSDLATWEKRAEQIKPSSQVFIDGKFVEAASGKTFDDISPRDQRVIAKIASGDVEDVNRAVASKVLPDAASTNFPSMKILEEGLTSRDRFSHVARSDIKTFQNWISE